ncbi:hypothetical protein HLH33_14140 [Gluconacetobacter diazotrophicus]|uniref:Uncharacterized protein n=1 Tax=Gluconacetobacter diazotrophicus TaxID=33996 RepID=A0A7W4I711_GLUDI|nr:hypothetical protein [Gluconacetobacter diazotrophicus]MBB2157441.1 hypothetical protein [Gluconacetobacter diazotrophicus]
MTTHHEPSAAALAHRLKEVERDLARAKKDNPEHVHALTEEKKKLQGQFARR